MDNFVSMNDSAILIECGKRIKQMRLGMNITQTDFANDCGISESTLKRVENGQDSQFSNLIRVLRYLGLINNLGLLIPEKEPDYKLLFENQEERQRASKKTKKTDEQWKWGDEQ